MSAIEGVVAYQGWSLRGVPLYNILYYNKNNCNDNKLTGADMVGSSYSIRNIRLRHDQVSGENRLKEDSATTRACPPYTLNG